MHNRSGARTSGRRSLVARLCVAMVGVGSLVVTRQAPAVDVTATGSEPVTAARTMSAFFVCTGGRSIRAVFNNGSRPRVALALSDGRYVVLPEAKSGSGARYANPEESFVFWSKGQTALIVERGKTTYAGCEKQGGS
jgi:membrane-bound inhibitor of C-type lysozyme